MQVTAYSLAQRFTGLQEVPGAVHNPAVLAMLRLVDPGVRDDETPWCSAFVHYVAWLLNLPRSKSLRARSWLTVGAPIDTFGAAPGYDVVVLTRAGSTAPASVLTAPGHVGFYAGAVTPGARIAVLGGNQSNRVSLEEFPIARVLGIRRLA